MSSAQLSMSSRVWKIAVGLPVVPLDVCMRMISSGSTVSIPVG